MPIVMAGNGAALGRRRAGWRGISLLAALPLLAGGTLAPIHLEGDKHGLYVGRFGSRHKPVWELDGQMSGTTELLLSPPDGVSLHRTDSLWPETAGYRVVAGARHDFWEVVIW